MHYSKIIAKKYDHAMSRLLSLFKEGIKRESELAYKLDLAKDEFQRILVCQQVTEEIKGLCDRAISNITT